MDKRIHDLAVAFASEKLKYALNNNLIKADICPKGIAEYEYFLDEYSEAYKYFDNCVIDLRDND